VSDAESLVLTYPQAGMLIGLAILSMVIRVHGVGVRLAYRHFTRTWAASNSA
jgi:hypothetical protein